MWAPISDCIHSSRHFCLCTEFVHNTLQVLIKCTEFAPAAFDVTEREMHAKLWANWMPHKVFPVVRHAAAMSPMKNETFIGPNRSVLFAWNAPRNSGVFVRVSRSFSFSPCNHCNKCIFHQMRNLESLIHLDKETTPTKQAIVQVSADLYLTQCNTAEAHKRREKFFPNHFKRKALRAIHAGCGVFFLFGRGETFALAQHKMRIS